MNSYLIPPPSGVPVDKKSFESSPSMSKESQTGVLSPLGKK
jgi:hypothetical protein